MKALLIPVLIVAGLALQSCETYVTPAVAANGGYTGGYSEEYPAVSSDYQPTYFSGSVYRAGWGYYRPYRPVARGVARGAVRGAYYRNNNYGNFNRGGTVNRNVNRTVNRNVNRSFNRGGGFNRGSFNRGGGGRSINRGGGRRGR